VPCRFTVAAFEEIMAVTLSQQRRVKVA